MAVPLRLTALCGARADGAPLAHLLEIGPPDAQLTVLLDCGWGGIASGGGGGSASSGGGADGDADLAALLAALPRADAVLLSHPGPRHCGALAAAARRGLLGAPVFGTAPIAKMGAMFAYDTYLSAQVSLCLCACVRVFNCVCGMCVCVLCVYRMCVCSVCVWCRMCV